MIDKSPKPSAFPTREAILALIRQSPVPLGKRDIAKAFKITGSDRIP